MELIHNVGDLPYHSKVLKITRNPRQGSASFLCKGPDGKYVRLYKLDGVHTMTQLCCRSVKAATDAMSTNERGHVPITLGGPCSGTAMSDSHIM